MTDPFAAGTRDGRPDPAAPADARAATGDPWLAGKEDTASDEERNPLTGAEADFAARRVSRAAAATGHDGSPDAAA